MFTRPLSPHWHQTLSVQLGSRQAVSRRRAGSAGSATTATTKTLGNTRCRNVALNTQSRWWSCVSGTFNSCHPRWHHHVQQTWSQQEQQSWTGDFLLCCVTSPGTSARLFVSNLSRPETCSSDMLALLHATPILQPIISGVITVLSIHAAFFMHEWAAC